MLRGFFGVTIVATLLFAACSSGDDNGAAATPDGGAGDGSFSDGSSDGAPAITCTPPTGNPPAGSAIIFQAPSPVLPGQAALLFGASVGATAKVSGVRLDDGDPGLPPRVQDCVPPDATALEVLQASDLSVKAVIPTTWQPGLFALTVTNAAGIGSPVVLNRPRVDWIRGAAGGSIASSGSFDAYGRSFGPSPSAWLVDASGKSTELTFSSATASDGYAATFKLPTLPSGPYSLYIHSGQGGPYGFSEPLMVTVSTPTPWPSTVYPVAAGTTNDDNALAAAITLAKNNGGGIVELATGNYVLTQSVSIPPKTILRSASGNRSDVKIVFNQPSIPFPYAFAGSADFSVESITVTSSTSARLFQCPAGVNYFRDPSTGGPQYQPDAPCENAKLHDVSFTLNTLRNLVSMGVQTTTPTGTILAVCNGNDCEISDSSLVNNGGSAVSLAREDRLYVMRNTLVSGTTRTPPDQGMPYTGDVGSAGGGDGMYDLQHSAIVGNTVGPTPNLGASSTMFIEYQAHDLYIADNKIGPNLSDYGEGFSFDAPYYPNFLGLIKAASGRTVTIPRVLNSAGNTVFAGPLDGTWPAATSAAATSSTQSLVGSSLVVVNGTGLGQYAEVISNAASAADDSTLVTIDRDFSVPLDKTSVIEIATLKSEVVFARNDFHDVAVGAQLYAGAYDFIIDGTTGASMEGTYCYGYDFMSNRGSAADQQRRFARCYFNQWLNTKLSSAVDPSYPWAKPDAGPGVSTPYVNGLVGAHVATAKDPLLPAERGIGAIGNIVRSNDVEDFTYGFAYSVNGPIPSPAPVFGRDNIVEQNTTQSVPIGVYVDNHFPDTLLRNNSCTSNCDAGVKDFNDGG